MTIPDLRPTVRLGDAARAMKSLLANPEDTAQVFRIIEALSGRNGERTLARLRRTRSGKRLLAERPALMDRLLDRASLEKLPAGSLGREYLRFLDAEGITAEGLMQASEEELRARIQSRTGVSADSPASFYAFQNVEENVRHQLQKLRAHPWIPEQVAVRGFAYDVTTGLLREVT